MNSNSPYGVRANGEAHGDVFTHPDVVSYMLDLVGYVPTRDLSEVTILEPSCGEGEFAVEILRRLMLSANNFSFDVNEAAHRNIFAYELDNKKIGSALLRIQRDYPQIDTPQTLIRQGDFLKATTPQVDIVVGNPPYVRYEQLSDDMIDFCKRTFPTFHYRADLYIPFYEKTLRTLNPGGKHCFICSNRWLKNEYGRKLRRMVAEMFKLEKIIDLEKAHPFQEDVLAYTDIVLISNNTALGTFEYCEVEEIELLQQGADTKQLAVPNGDDWSDVFNRYAQSDSLYNLEELGLKIGIGVATGADAIFISPMLKDEVEEDLLIPVIGGRDLRGNEFKWQGQYLLNPYTKNGALIRLDNYTRAKAYLSKHEAKLRGRHTAQKHPNSWYRTIDRINPELQYQPKILLPDMSANTYIFVDSGHYYPAHNLYYITGTDERHLKLLAAILMSDFILQQLSGVTNSMNGGFVRWQSQHLHKLRVPDVFSIPMQQASSLIETYNHHDLTRINQIVDEIVHSYSMPPIGKKKKRKESQQLALAF